MKSRSNSNRRWDSNDCVADATFTRLNGTEPKSMFTLHCGGGGGKVGEIYK